MYGVALHSSGEVGKGIAVLERAHALHPADRDILTALITMERDRGDLQEALQYAGELTRLLPDNPAAAALMEELRRGGQGKEAADSK
jgi:Flp pilus assembly protein TadD